jgi:broad specificity phosphatase PhoE
MSTLTLVRHGQATPFEKETDRLSPLGEQQSAKLGEFWRQHGVQFHEAVSGTLQRHRQTAEAVLRQCPLPEIRPDAGWNEYDAGAIMTHLGSALAQQEPGFAALRAAYEENRNTPDRNRHFQRMLEALMNAWLAGRVQHPDVESYADFAARVEAACQRILSGPPGRDVVVFTSGGPIGWCVRRALQAPAQAFLDVNWRMRNASVTEFTFSSTRFTLDSLNGLAHLSDRAWWTWR